MTALAKRIAKYLLAAVLYYSGMLAFFSLLRRFFFNRSNFVILMYHQVLEENDVEKDYVQPGLYVSRQVFEKQMAFLSEKYNLLSLERVTEILEKNQSPPLKSIVITFDDGWRDNYLYAYPILKKYNVPATIFLATDYVGTDKMFWFLEASILMTNNRLTKKQLGELIAKYAGETDSSKILSDRGLKNSDDIPSVRDWFIESLKRLDAANVQAILKELSARNEMTADSIKVNRSMLTWEEVMQMNHNGIDFGSHGCSHRIMPALTDAEIQRELRESKRIIEQRLGREIKLFAYPNGNYSNHIREMVQDCGYVCALATGGKKEPESGTDLYSLKRINVHEGVSVGPTGKFSPAMFSFHIFRNS